MFANTQEHVLLILWCFLFGIATGIVCDFLRAFRMKNSRHILPDVLLITAFFICLFIIGYTAGGGAQRLYLPAFTLCSCALYFCGLSAVFRPLFEKFASIILYPLKFFAKTAKKLCKLLKKSFYSSKFCYTIKCKRESAKDEEASEKGTADETEKGRYYY